eukprot:14071233-Alexandrium_andersonii.AAC.1
MRRPTSWALPRSRDGGGPQAAAAAEEGASTATGAPVSAMNRSGWTEEQIEARRQMEAAGL